MPYKTYCDAFEIAIGLHGHGPINGRKKSYINTIITTNVESYVDEVFNKNHCEDNWNTYYNKSRSFPLTIDFRKLLAFTSILCYAEYRYKHIIESSKSMSKPITIILMTCMSFYENQNCLIDDLKRIKFENERELIYFFQKRLTKSSIDTLFKMLKTMKYIDNGQKWYDDELELNKEIAEQIIYAAIHKEKLQEKHYKSSGNTQSIFIAKIHKKFTEKFMQLSSKGAISMSASTSISPVRDNSKNNNNNYSMCSEEEEEDQYEELINIAKTLSSSHKQSEQRENKEEENDEEETDDNMDDVEVDTEVEFVSTKDKMAMKQLNDMGYKMDDIEEVWIECKENDLLDNCALKEDVTRILLNHLQTN